MDLYNAGDYAGAVPHLKRAHEMEPSKFEYRFALAQALRQSGNCAEAVPHYNALITTAPNATAADDVRNGLALCPTVKEPEAAPPPPPPPPAPEPVVTSSGGGISTAHAGMFMASGASLGAAVILFFSARGDSSDADNARSFADHERLSSRSDMLYVAAGVTAGLGVALAAVSFMKLKAARESNTEISISPRKGGGTLVLERSW